ncbi:ABC-type transport auxiliary lipoprotein family protein [Pseudoxanthomonas sp. CF125]|uniref:ABC-type transport auxiliary lipoprotein family protein n=1 Tax=Pseudoxanthomonas sp. CF125 TaxID=1855303 RepID=UPI00087FFE7D|nr:ABC-type transport auxiliary lipoprotein family protein [Pseudoxanthomonas sp. CF125]SDQ89199.1 cholesterol transport system auxiliary component [Pseudoxanthomonas sp. CF125]
MKSMRPASLRLLSVAMPLMLLTGCSVLGNGKQRDPVTIYAPQVKVTPDPSWPSVTWQLAVAKPTAARVVDSPRIAVRPVPGELQVYKSVTWSQPSTDLIEATVLRALEDSGKIPAVARAGSGIRADYRLIMDLRRYEADYAGNTVPSATIELTAKLLHTSDQRIVASRTFLQVEPSAGVEVAQVATAFDTALEKLGSEVVGWVLTTGKSDASRDKR